MNNDLISRQEQILKELNKTKQIHVNCKELKNLFVFNECNCLSHLWWLKYTFVLHFIFFRFSLDCFDSGCHENNDTNNDDCMDNDSSITKEE